MAKKSIPIPINQPQEYEKADLPDASTLGATFVDLGKDVAKLNAKRKQLDDEIKVLYQLMREQMEDHDDSQSWGVRGPGWTCSYVKPGPRETLVKELLIQQGVSMKQIQKATKSTPVTPYVTVRLSED